MMKPTTTLMAAFGLMATLPCWASPMQCLEHKAIKEHRFLLSNTLTFADTEGKPHQDAYAFLSHSKPLAYTTQSTPLTLTALGQTVIQWSQACHCQVTQRAAQQITGTCRQD